MESKPDSKNLTPEERLFKVIQDNETKEKEADTVLVRESSEIRTEKSARWKLPLRFGFRRGGVGLLAGVPGSFQGVREGLVLPTLSVRKINHVLFVLFLAFLCYFLVGQVFFRKSSSGKLMAKAQGSSAVLLEVPRDLFTAQEVDDSREALADRNIFQPYRMQERPKATSAPETQSVPSNLTEIVAMLKLSGTYLSDQNEALIELIDEKRTVSVPQGGTIKGLTVKEIRSDAVVLSDGTAETTLQ